MIKKSKQKKNKNGLVIDENLSVNKTAGFKAVKRDKSVNRRAGLHDKKKNMQGDSKLLKRRPLTLKRKRIARKVAAVLSVVFVGAVSYVGVGFLKKDNTPIDDPGYATVRYATPSKGAPTDHTVVENVAYLNYVLHNQSYWSSKMTCTVYNSFMPQTVETYKQFYDGKLISEDVESGFSSKITQFCIPEDVSLWRDENGVNHGVDNEWIKKSVLWRGGKGDYNGTDTNWLTTPASGSVITDYRKERGLPPSEFATYILNELTIKNAAEKSVTDNGDGTFSMTLHLNVNPEGETSAVHYYKQQMKVKGGLSEMPKYSYTDITYVFDAGWRVLESEIKDAYRVKMGLSVDCTSVTHTVYDYGDMQKVKEAVTGYYNNYFVKYKDKFSSEVIGTPDPDATSLLGTAFASVLTEGATFKVNLGLDGKTTQAYAYVGMDGGNLSDLRVTLGKDISVYLAEEAEKQTLFLKLGSNAKIKMGLDELTSAFVPATPETPADPDAPSDNEDGGSTSGFSVDDLLKQVLGGELTFNEAKTKATLKSTVNIFGVTAQLDFYFNLNLEAEIPDDTVNLDHIGASLVVGGSKVDANLRFADNEKPANLTAVEKSSYQDVFKNGLSLRGKLDIKAGGTLVSLIVENCALSFNGGLSVALKAKIVAGGTYNDIYARYKGGKLTFTYGNEYAIKTIEELVDGDENSDSVSGIVGAVIDMDGGDLQTLETAVVTLYNRIIGVANTMLENDDLKTAGTLNDILKALTNGKNLTATLDGLYKLLGVPANADGKYTVESALSGLNLYATGSDVGIKLGALGLDFGFDETGAVRLNLALSISGKEVSLRLSDFSVTAYELPAEPAESGLLTASDFAEMLDYLGAAVDILVQENVTATVNGSVDSGDGNGYSFNAKLQYSMGANGFPVHINTGKVNENGVREDVNFWIDDTVYAHFDLQLISKSASADSMYLDFYILDANPTSVTQGKTDGAYSTDKKLDIYFSISKYPETAENYNPLKLYLPVEDLLTIASMGVSMLDVGGLDFSGNTNLNEKQIQQLNNAVKEISNILNQLLVSKYLPEDADRYVSLGDSIINQILSSLGAKQQNLQQLLNSVIDSLFANTNKGVQDNEEQEPEIREGNYVKCVSMKDGMNIVLNSATIYGDDREDLSVLITKQGSGEGSLITGVTFDNIYFGENNATKLNLALGLDYQKVEKPEALADFKDFGNIDTLIKALVNSATHKTTQAEYENGVKTDYKLNNSFYIDGGVTLTLNLGGFWDIKDVKVNLDGFKVTIDENNKVSFDLTISYKKTSFVIGILDNDATVDMSVRDDMIYMRKTTDGGNSYNYRILTAEAFSADIFKQLKYMFSFSDTVMSFFPDKVEDSGYKLTFDDYGDYISKFISVYQSSVDGLHEDWTVNINGELVGGFINMKMEDIVVKFKADKQEDGTYLVNALDLSGNMNPASGVYLGFTANLNYCNPQDDNETPWANGKTDLTTNIPEVEFEQLGGKTFSQVFGGTSYKEISKHINWAQLIADTGKNCLDYNPADNTLRVSDLAFEKAVIGGGFERFGNTVSVLYNTSNGNIYTYYVKPDIGVDEMPLFNGVSPEWETSHRVDGDTLVSRAVYNVSYVQSAYAIDESYIWNDILQTYVKTFEIGASGEKIYLPKDVIVEKDGEYYGLSGYASAGGETLNLTTFTDNSGKEWYEIHADEKFAVEAVWTRVYSVQVNIESNITVDGIDGYNYDGAAYSKEFEINGMVALPDIANNAIDKTYYFDGYYANADYSGEKYASGYSFSALNNVTYFAKWSPKTIEITYVGKLQMNGFDMSGEDFVKTETHSSALGTALVEPVAADSAYTFLGWWYVVDGNWTKIDDVTALLIAAEGATAESLSVNALWGKVSFTSHSGKRDGGFFTHPYKLNCSVEYEIVGESSLVEKVGLANVTYIWYTFDSAASKKTTTWDAGTTLTNYSNKFDSALMMYNYDLTAQLTLTLPDGSSGVISAKVSGGL